MREAVVSYLRGRFTAMEHDGFSLLRRIPSYAAMRFPTAFSQFTKEEKESIRTLVAERGAELFGLPKTYSDSDPGWKIFNRCVHNQIDHSHFPRTDRPIARASDLRKVAKLAFQQLLNARPEKSIEPGDWLYPGILFDLSVTVTIRYSNRLAPLCYEIQTEHDVNYFRRNFETLYGFGAGYWDLIYLDSIDAAFATLKEVIAAYVRDYCAVFQLLNRSA